MKLRSTTMTCTLTANASAKRFFIPSKICALLMLAICLFSSQANAQTGSWTALSNLAPSGHFNAGVMLLLPDGTVLCKNSSGGASGGVGISWDRLTPSSTGSYAAGTWSSVTSMADDRLYFSSQVMNDGRVYVAGGEYSWSAGSTGTSLTPTAKGEVYNMVTNSWASVPTYSITISDANSAMLPSGKILQAAVKGGTTLREAFVYDPSTNTHVRIGNSHGIHNESAWVTLPDGSVLFVDRLSTNSERYIPASNTWVTDATLPDSLYDPYGDETGGAILLPNGKAFFIGSAENTAIYTPSGTTSPGSWTAGANIPTVPGGTGRQGAPDAACAMMVNGKILLAVSPEPRPGNHFPDSTSFYEYDYVSNTFTLVNGPFGGSIFSGTACYVTNMLCLPNGQILFVFQGYRQYFVYTPGSSALSAGRPTVNSVSRINCDTFRVIGTLFHGITEGASYGDDWQMSTNYPLVRLTSGSTVKYARTYGWNHQGAVATGSALDTVNFVLPSGFTPGSYTLEVVANGNPSSGTGINTTLAVSPTTVNVCPTATATLTPTWTGGTWSSSATGTATVNSTTGVVTGVASGTAIITYTLSTGCFTTATVNVSSSLPSIGGTFTVCVGATTTLTNSTSGGVWTSGATGVASVGSSSGVVTGVSSGTATITYNAGGCTATQVVTVNPLATPGTISGTPTVCVGATTALSASGTSGGTWSSTNTAAGTVSTSGVVTGMGSGTTTISYTVTNGCGAVAATLIVTVNPLATPGTISGTPTVCVGATTALTASGTSGGTWSSANTAVGTVSTSGVVMGIANGTTTISYTVTNGCGAVAATQIVTVNPLATPGTISGTPSVCVGSTTSLTASGTSGGTWSSTNTAVGTVSTSGVVRGMSNGTTTISYTVTNGCGAVAATQVVTVNPLATPGTISGTPTVCVGATTALTASGTSGGTWSSSSTAIGSVSTSGVVMGIANGTTTISYTVTNGCGAVAATQIVTVNPLATPGTISGASSVCENANITLTASGTGGGTWSSTSTATGTVTTGGVVTGIAAGTTTISYTVTNSCGAVAATKIITVNTSPGAITGTFSICTATATTLNATPSGGTWTSSNSSIATIGIATGIANGVAAGTNVMTYTLTGGCFSTHTFTVTANPSAITGATTVCIGLTTTLNSTPSGGTWTSSASGTASVNSTSGVVTGGSAGTATITYTISGGCFAVAPVTVNANPTAITGTPTVCVGATTTLNSTPSGGVWTVSNTSLATVGSSTGVVTGMSTGVVTLTYMLSTGCIATQPVTVSPFATPGTISGTPTVCVGANTALSASGTGGGTWSSTNMAVGTVSSVGIVAGLSSGTTTISYTVTNGCGAVAATQTVTVSIGSGSITGTATVCTGATTTLNATPSGGTWTSSATGTATVNSTSGVVTGSSAGTATITYTLSGGCFTTQVVTVTASPSAITGTFAICAGSTTTLNSTPSGGTWTSSATSIAVVGSASGVAVGVANGMTNITYTLGSCFATQTITVVGTPSAITGTTTICTGTISTLASTPSGGIWTSSNTGVANVGSTTGNVSGVSAGTADITYTISGGCFAATTVTVIASPAAITGTLFICAGSGTPTTLSSATSGGTWTSTTTSVATAGSASGVITGVANGTSIISYTISNGCSATATVTVFAIAPITGPSGVICLGTSSTFADASPGGTWSSSASFIATIGSGSGILTAISLGCVTITYTVPGGCIATYSTCTGDLPAGFVGASSVCAGSTVAYTYGSAGGTWTSSNSGIASVASSGSASSNVTGVAAGTANITYTLSGTGCFDVQTISVNPLPPISGASSVCVGSTTALSSSSPGGIWTSSSPGVAGVGSLSGTVSGVSAGTANITYTLGTGCFSVKPMTVNTTPSAISGTPSACIGLTTALSSSPSGGTWTSTVTGVATVGSTTGVVLGVGSGGTVISYTLAGGCGAGALVTIYANPTAITGASSICTGASTTLSSTPTGGTWTSGTSGVATIGSTSGTVTGAGPGTTLITYTAPTSGCTVTRTQSVNATPTITPGPNPTVVSGSVTANLTYSGATGGPTAYSVAYSSAAHTAGFTDVTGLALTTPIVLTVPAAAPLAVYTATLTVTNGTCTSTTYPISVTVALTADFAPTFSGGSPQSLVACGNPTLNSIDALLTIDDADVGDVETWTVISGPSHGSITTGGTVVSTGSVVTPSGFGYTATAGYSGTDAFTIEVSDGVGGTATTTINVTVNPSPAAFTVTGGGAFCAGGAGYHILLSGSATGISYQLFNGASPVGTPLAGTGAAVDFGLFTTAGIYTVVATNTTTGCTNNMTGSATIVINPLPTLYSLTGGGTFCAGGSAVSIGLSGSDAGVNYQLFRGSISVGGSVSGTGSAITFGTFTIAGAYSVVATNPTTGCTRIMTGSSTIVVYPIPAIVSVTGGGGYCAGGIGVNVGLAGSAMGILYQLYLGGTPVGIPVPGIGASLSFGLQTAAGVYTATATNPATGCTSTMAGSVTVYINPLPNAYTVTGGGSYCAGGTGVAVGLSNTDIGVNYQLYRGGLPIVGTITAGTGAAISFGLQTIAGTYTVVATIAGPSGCTNTMTGSATIVINPLPLVYSVTGGGGYCVGGTGVHVGLSNSATGTDYQLYMGTTPIGSSLAGTGAPLDFGLITTPGSYSVIATNTTTGCVNSMSGSVSVIVNPLPTVFTVTGGGGYCTGGPGIPVGLSASTFGVSYQLFRSGSPIGSPIPGIGSAITFGLQTVAGTYTVVATNTTTGCVNNMSGSVTITVNFLPTIYSVTGGGNYCAGGAGLPIGLSNSDAGINYQLYRGSLTIGGVVGGTGGAISFGLQTIPGTYTVLAYNPATGCSSSMTGSAVITTSLAPAIVTMTGGGGYCSGGVGVNVGLAASAIGINYQLYLGGSPVGSVVAGIGSALSFGLQTTAGAYTATATDPITGCTSTMAGTVSVYVYSLPNVYSVTGGGSYCAGGTGVVIGLSNSDVGTTYQLYTGGLPVPGIVAGTGSPISFPPHTLTGTYTVVATNGGFTGCSTTMSGSASISIDPAPTAYPVTGGGSYCYGGTGVHVGLSTSDAGVNYQLYRGTTAVGSAISGTGSALDFGLQTTAGLYTVMATNTTTGCTGYMTGSVSILIDPLPAAFTVTGGGGYCTGGSGVAIGLAGTVTGTSYQLFLGSTPVGSPVTGTGSSISFGLQTTVGTYTVEATNSTTGCVNTMGGSATVTINALPGTFTVTGGGNYCSGGGGLHIYLTGSSTGIQYQLYRGTSAVGAPVTGTGSALDFGLQTVAGTYTVVATAIGTLCTSTMTGSATINIDPLPTAYTVTGGGGYCTGGTGVHIYLSNSDAGISYQLLRGTTTVGSPLTGTGSGLDFGLQTTSGTYTVVATNSTTGCINTMTGTVTITINPLPTAYTMAGGGGYCAGGTGVPIYLSGSQTGVSYQLYIGSTPTGSPMTGTTAGLAFGLQTTAGTYTIVATNTATGCVNTMTGSLVVTINPLPVVYTTTGGGNYCAGGAGLPVGVASSDAGISYQLYRGTGAVGSPVAGTGGAISFGAQTIAGTYSVRGTSSAGCISNMSGTVNIVIDPLPATVTVTGGGGYCTGGAGVSVGLASSAVGINYQLYMGSTPIGSPVAGTGSALSFGLQTVAGTYTAKATNPTTSCTSTMSGSVNVYVYSLPIVYTVTGGGSFCTGGTGVAVGLSGSSIGTSYQLYRGTTAVGSLVAGTGTALNFGLQTIGGTYTVTAVIGGFTGCTNTMTGSATVTVIPAPTAYTVTGGGSYCTGGTGVHIYLSNSDAGYNYQLYRGTTAVGSPIAGTGSSIDFGLQTTAGTYTVTATGTTSGCTGSMTGSATITINPLPAAFTVMGGGSYCAGGTGVSVYLSGSVSGISYQLYLGSTAVGSPLSGTGAGLSFGLQTTAGTYTAVATNTTTGCTSTMTGSVVITITPSPVAYTVTGGGGYCTGGTGLHIYLSSSATGVSYQLYRGSIGIGSPLPGTGSPIDFGLQTTAGTYTVVATITGTHCSANMSGSATITINPLPTAYTMTGGGGYCPGGTGVSVGLTGSQSGVSYQLYIGTTATGSPVAGTGSAISFGLQTTAGSYTAIATEATTGCMRTMTSSVTVSVNPLPTAYTLTGGGSYCAGGTGVSIGLSGSQSGVTYRLYLGTALAGSPVTGSGTTITFGPQTAAGVYTVVATRTSTGCTNNMTGTATVAINALPGMDTVTGGGSYCAGGTGIAVGMNHTYSGVNYRLYRGTTALGSPVAGTGSAISFGLQTVAGTYTVIATSSTSGCTRNMAGSATITIASVPAIVSVTGGGGYCAGGSGVVVGLSGSATGINYQLYRGSTAVGSPVAGIGSALSFGLQTTAGTYTVIATYASSSCSSNMSGSATVTVYTLPSVYTVTGGGSYCSGGSGVHVYLSGSSTGTTYKLYRSGTPASAAIAGTGSAIDFGLLTIAGTYTVVATSTSNGCTINMTGSATISINPLPTVTGTIYTVAPSASITLTGSISGGSWSSSNTAVATVGATSGIVTGVSLGAVIINYTLSTGCSGTHIVSVTATGHRDEPGATGTEANAHVAGTVTVLPNPNKGIFTVRGAFASGNDEEVVIEIMDVTGKVVYQTRSTAHNGILDEQISIGNVANGTYILNLHSDNEHHVIRVEIQH